MDLNIITCYVIPPIHFTYINGESSENLVKRQFIYIQQYNIYFTEKNIWNRIINEYDAIIREEQRIKLTNEIIKIFPKILKRNILFTFFNKPIDYKKPYLINNEPHQEIKITYNTTQSIISVENLQLGVIKYIHLSDFINYNEKTILFNGHLQIIKESDIHEIHFTNCNFQNIELYNDEIITQLYIIKLYNCINFRSISYNLSKFLKEVYINDIKIDIINGSVENIDIQD